MAIGENNCGFYWYVYCRVGPAGAQKASEQLGAWAAGIGYIVGGEKY